MALKPTCLPPSLHAFKMKKMPTRRNSDDFPTKKHVKLSSMPTPYQKSGKKSCVLGQTLRTLCLVDAAGNHSLAKLRRDMLCCSSRHSKQTCNILVDL